MYHISDLKKYNRCPRLYLYDKQSIRPQFQHYVRLDETVTDLAAEKLGLHDYYLGVKNDPAERALEAMKTNEWLVKARFEYKQLRIKVPFLHKTEKGWDLYFLFIGLYPHDDDMQFYCDTVWVLKGLQIKLNEIYLIHLNADYVRGDTLDLQELFVISKYFYNGKNHPTQPVKETIEKNMQDLTSLMNEMDHASLENLPSPVRKQRCAGRQKCRFYDTCFPNEVTQPCNSILTLTGARYRYEMKKEGRLYLKNADESRIEGSRQQYAEIMADRNGGLFCDKNALRSWLGDISFPITFLDFEWECYAIPPYQGMRPYEVLPFEYSIHVMQKDGTITHKVFLSVHDDRLEMVQSLLHDIPEEGSVIAYNAIGAEMLRIDKFAEQFPQYRKQLLNINKRMKDLQLPFTSGIVYHTGMAGVWTLKKIMSLMHDKSYNELAIHQGMDAVFQWRHLDRNDPDYNKQEIIDELKEYCGMDSYAMTVIYKWLTMIAK